MSLVHFLPTIIMNITDTTLEAATTSLTLFWITMVIGRFFAGNLAERFGYIRYLSYCSLGSLFFLILFFFMTDLWSSYAMILLLGLAMSGIFAIALLFANARIPGMTERTTSLLIAAGGVGGALMPRLIGWMLDEYSLLMTQWVFISMTALLIILIALAAFVRSRQAFTNNLIGK